MSGRLCAAMVLMRASEAAKRKFSPEFMNRLDKVIVFRSLKDEHLERILDIELSRVQERIVDHYSGSQSPCSVQA